MQLCPEKVPVELRDRPQWVCFQVNGKSKTPYIARNPTRRASSTNADTWGPFSDAVNVIGRHGINAVAYALNGDYVAVDIDGCIVEGKLSDTATEIVSRCASYSERSFSGKGVHILLRGTLPGKGRKLPACELYDRSRFLIFTGDTLTPTPAPIRDNPDAISWLLARDTIAGDEATQIRGEVGDGVARAGADIASDCSACSVLSDISVLSVTSIMEQTEPSKPGQRNEKLFNLARGLRFNAGMGSATWGELKPIVRQWYNRALPIIRTKNFTATWADFVYAWTRVHLPLGYDVLAVAWKQAQSEPQPPIAAGYDDEPVRRLVALCAQLARFNADMPFFLSTRDGGKLLGVKPMTVSRWLRMLVADEVLELVKIGNEHRASRFRWNGGAA